MNTTLLRTVAAGLLAGASLVGTAAYAGAAAPSGPDTREHSSTAGNGGVEQLYRVRVSVPLDVAP